MSDKINILALLGIISSFYSPQESVRTAVPVTKKYKKKQRKRIRKKTPPRYKKRKNYKERKDTPLHHV